MQRSSFDDRGTALLPGGQRLLCGASGVEPYSSLKDGGAMVLRGGWRRNVPPWMAEVRQSTVENRGTTLLFGGQRVESPGLWSLGIMSL